MKLSLAFAALVLFSSTVQAGPIIAIAGDSMACTYTNYPARGWGQEMPLGFTDEVAFGNFAASGSSSKSFFNGSSAVDGIPSGQPNSIHRWANLLASNPDYVLISFGWNDKGTSNDPERYCPIADYQANLARMIDDARAIGAKPLLITAPTNRYFTGGILSNGIRDYADAMIAVGVAENAPCYDLNASLASEYQSLGQSGASVFGFSQADMLHFGEWGATRAAELISGGLLAAYPELRIYSVPEPSMMILLAIFALVWASMTYHRVF